MPRVLVPLAEGFEELEAVTIIDLLRRAEMEVVTAGLQPGPVTGSRRTVIIPDTTLETQLAERFDMIVLPGGLPGADHLDADPRLKDMLRRHAGEGRYTAAICAAPKVLANAGLLDDRDATAYPGALGSHAYPRIRVLDAPVVVDGALVTSRGPGTAMDFALSLIELLAGRERRDAVETALVRPGTRS
jgi:4-methyl-5(b-hydroxyethyl)-thiazole monophosphate biosynthesis